MRHTSSEPVKPGGVMPACGWSSLLFRIGLGGARRRDLISLLNGGRSEAPGSPRPSPRCTEVSMSTTRRDVTALVILNALLAIPASANDSDRSSLLAGTASTVTFPTSFRFAQRLLPAGAYRFQCDHHGKYHLMTAYRISADSSGRAVTLGQPVAEDFCRMEALPERVKFTFARTTKNAAGSVVLKEVQIQGDGIRHIFGEVLGFDRTDD